MCEPTSIIAGISAVGSIASTVAKAGAQNDAANLNTQSALAAQKQALGQLSLRQMQEQQAAGQSIFQSDLAARRADAQARVQAGESGVAGASVDMLLSDVERQRLMNRGSINTNLQNTQDQIAQQRLGVMSETQSRINSVPKANPFATGLQIGGDLVQGYGEYTRNIKPHIGG